MSQCKAKTKKGQPCQIAAHEGHEYCHVHRRQRKKIKNVLSRFLKRFFPFLNLEICLIIFFYGVGFFFLSKRQYVTSALLFGFAFIFVLEIIDNSGRIYTLSVLFFTISTLVLMYFGVVIKNSGFLSDVAFEVFIPENEVIPEGTSYSIFLEESSSPVYISAYPLDDSYIFLSVYDPTGNHLHSIKNYHLWETRVRRTTTKETLVFEFCYYKTGNYQLDIRISNYLEGSVKLQVYDTKWPQFLDIDRSNCP